MARSSRGTGRSARGRAGTYSKRAQDLKTIEGLVEYAKTQGLGAEAEAIANPRQKLGTLQRIGALFGALNPAEALLTASETEQGKSKALAFGKSYVKSVGTGIASAVTGRQYGTTRRYFSDVADELGIENKIARFGVGFLGDVLLDPSTYFGGAIAKGIIAGTKGATNIGLKTVGRVAPEVEAGLRMAGTGAQDAVGRAFIAGYKSSDGAMGDLLASLSKKSRVLTQAASDQLSNLGVKGLTEEQRIEVGLKAALGKRAEFLLGEKIGGDAGRLTATKMIAKAKKTGNWSELSAIDPELAKQANATFDTVAQAEYFAKQQERIGALAARAGIEDPYAVYFPFIKRESVEKFSRDIERAGIRVGSQAYRKQFKNLLTLDNIELDPAQAFFTREAQILGDLNAKETLNEFVQKYGKPLSEFATEDEARKLGFRILKEKGGLGKPVGYVSEWDAKLFNDLIRPEFMTVNMLAKATGFDAVTSLFKRSVTGLFLPFHVRNYASGMIQNFETVGVAALYPTNIAAGQKMALDMVDGVIKNGDTAITMGGNKYTYEQIFRPMFEKFSGDTFYNNDFNTYLKAGENLLTESKLFSKQRLKNTLKTGGMGQEAIPFKAARAVGQFIEHQQKATAYITALNQGKSIPQALALAERAGFDYRALTAFESQVMRRIIPFYSYARKNLELQLRTAGETPQRINQVIRFFANNPLQLVGIESGTPLTDEERAALPDFLKESLGPQLEDTPEGLKQFVSSFGSPIEAFAQLFGDNQVLRGISMMNPILKVPVEIGIGKDSFRKNDIQENYTAKEYSAAPQIVKDILKIKEVKKDILKKLPNGKLIKVGERTVYVADPIRLLVARALPTSRGVSYLDQLFDGDLQGFVKYLNAVSGVKTTQVDIAMQQGIKEKEKKEQLQDLLVPRTDLRKFETVYEQK